MYGIPIFNYLEYLLMLVIILQVTFEAQIWGDGGWKRNFVHYSNNDPCVTFKFLFGSPVEDIFVKANHSKNCPGNPVIYQN